MTVKRIVHESFSLLRQIARIESFLLAIIGLNFILHIPFLSRPALDTETSYYFAAMSISEHNFNFFTPTFEEKPPLVFALPSLLLRFFPLIFWGRLQSLLCASLALFYVYKIGKKIHSSILGLFAVLLCVFYPMFTIQSVFFTDSMPETAVFLAMIFYAISSRRNAYLIAGFLAVLTKESLALMPIILYFFTVGASVWKERSIFVTSWKTKAFLLIPLFIFFCWMGLNKVLFGHFFFPGNQINLLNGFRSLGKNHHIVLQYIVMFVTHAGASVIFSGIALLGSVFAFVKIFRLRTMRSGYMVFFFCITVIYLLFYAFFFSWSLRYVLFLYPIVFLIFLKLIFEFLSVRFCTWIVVLCCSMFCFSQWNIVHTDRISIYGEAIDLRSIAQQAYMHKIVKEISSYDTHIEIYTDFQLAHYLWLPLFGYVESIPKNIFQVQQPTAYDNCPTCTCSKCVSTTSLPKNKKLIFVFMTGIDYPWIQNILKKSKVIKTIKPDWPDRATDEFTVYEYYDSSE